MTITTAEELDALPRMSIIIDGDGDAYQKFDEGWRATYSANESLTPADLPERLTLVHRPGQPTKPAQVLPSREQIAHRITESHPTWRYVGPIQAAMADAILALFADQPTVAEVKAEALREAGVAAGVKAVTDRVRAFIGTFDEVREDDGEDPVALIVRVKDVRRLLDQIDAEWGQR